MAYQRINFKNQSVERPRTYEMSHNADGSVTLVDSFGLVDELGTPINADTMGHIEDGIEAAAIRHYNSTETYNEKEWVLGSVDNTQTIFKSLIPSNIGNPLTNKNAWEEVKLGGNGGAMPIGTVFSLNCSSSYVPEGCLPCDGAEYSKAQFKQLWENYFEASLLNTCTYSEYEADLTTYGQCSKFAVSPLEYDGSGLTIVGSPTITEDGIASGFMQGSSYITASLNINATKMIVRNKFNYKVNSADNSILYWFNGIALRQFIVNNGDLRIDGTASPSNLYINVPASNFKENDVVETELIIADTVQLNIKVNGVALQQYTSDRIPTLSNITQVGIGSSYYQGNNPYQGLIDLKGFSIEADGQTVISGGIGDTFKVPTIKDGAVVQQAMSDSELGKSYNAGLPIPPQHTHSPIVLNGSNDDDGDNGTLVVTSPSGSNGTHNMKNSSTGEATWNEDTIYGSSATVQMNAVALRYFVVVANGQLEESAMNWSEWASSLQGKANKTDVDGQWVASKLTLSTTVTAGTYTLDLSDYLPADGYNYEVKIFGECFKEGSSASNVYVYTTIDNLTDNEIMATASSRRGRFYSIYTIDTSRTITMKIDVVVASLQILAVAYRRIGRNV